jgi:predicted GIY-YIG superfamily endonuclease
MPFHTYILCSASSGKYYVGHTENLSQRILEHNSNRAWPDRTPETGFRMQELSFFRGLKRTAF